jgi:hypothetical protein
VLRSTDAESRQRIVLVRRAPITLHCKLVGSSARYSFKNADASIINLRTTATFSASDLKASRNDIRTPLTLTGLSLQPDPPELCMAKPCTPPSGGKCR